MSRLHKVAVTGDGIKGWTGQVHLTGCDVFCGPNDAGKSTRLLAVMAGLRGLAQSPGDAVKVWLGPDRPEAVVTLAFDGGTVERQVATVSGKAAGRADADAERLAGPHVVRWDLADFATASDTVREDLIRRCAGASGVDAAKAAGMVSEKLAKAEDVPAAVRDAFLAALLKAVPATSADGSAWLESAIAWARTEFTRVNADAKAAEQGAKDAARAAEQAAPTGTLADARADVTRIEGELQSVVADLACVSSGAEALRSHQRRGDDLARAYAAAEERAELLRQRRPAAVPTVDDAATTPAIVAHEAAVEVATAKEAIVRDATARREAAAGTLTTAERAAGAADGAYKALLPLAEGASGACRHCGCEDPLGLQDKLAAARAACRVAGDARSVAEELLNDANDDLALAQGALRRAREAVTAAASARQAAVSARDRAKADAERITRENATLASDLEAAEKALAEAHAALAEWQAQPVPQGPAGGVDSLNGRKAVHETDLKAAKAAVEAHTRHQERQKAHQSAIARREETAAALAAVKALGAALKAVQADLATAAFGPITERANALLTVAASSVRVAFRSVSDYGAETPRGYVHFAALSDSKRAIVGAAIAYALIALSGAPWKGLLLDGLEKIDEDNLAGLLHGLGEMVARGELDNVIGALQTSNPTADVDGVVFHHLGASAQSEAV